MQADFVRYSSDYSKVAVLYYQFIVEESCRVDLTESYNLLEMLAEMLGEFDPVKVVQGEDDVYFTDATPLLESGFIYQP